MGGRLLKQLPIQGQVLRLLESEVPNALLQGHDLILGGHYGAKATLRQFGRQFWCPTIRKNVLKWVQTYETCQQNAPCQPVHPVEPVVAAQPLEWVQIDWILGLPETCRGNVCLIIGVDGFMGYVMAGAYAGATARNLAYFFTHKVMYKFGLPLKVQMDNGTHFLGEFRELCNQ